MTLSIDIRGENLVLDARKAVFLPEYKALIIADLHAGKAAHFRKSGVPVPDTMLAHDLAVLDALMSAFNPGKLVFAGDLFHSGNNSEWEDFASWLKNVPCDKLLTLGNHDILPRIQFETAGLICVDAIDFGNLRVQHEPPASISERYVLCGHLHPCYKMYGIARQSLTLPSFHFTGTHGVLPSFGRFTGCKPVEPASGDTIVLVQKQALQRLNL
jgi:DNA ligase-associated metallophosphoesterase